MCSIQLSDCKRLYRERGLEALKGRVAIILWSRDLIPEENPGVMRGMVRRVIVNHNYDRAQWTTQAGRERGIA